jgi:hypothetical protein
MGGQNVDSPMIADDTVADPRPEDMCDPFEAYWNSSPRYLIDVMSQFAPFTVKISALLEPASTTKSLPDLVTPKAASADEEREAAARSADLSSIMTRPEGNEGAKPCDQPLETWSIEAQMAMYQNT